MTEIKWTPQALNDLEAICLFIARDAPPFAAVFAEKVFKAIDPLSSFPQLGRVVPEIGDPAIREVLSGNYRIVYRVREDQVHILTVHHGSRLLDRGKIDTELN
jgi:plasmid stabilization system protein ParE